MADVCRNGSYSIWLTPEGIMKGQMQLTISRICEKYGTPVFEPHMTVLSGIKGDEDSIVSKTSKLAKVINPQCIELGKISYSDEYSKAVFVSVKKTNSIEEVNSIAQKVFGIECGHYDPYISLACGNFDNATKRKIIIFLKRYSNNSIVVPMMNLSLCFVEDNSCDFRKIVDFPIYKERRYSSI